MNKRLENKNDITLIVLVITIVILIVLAGIAIVALGEENGLLTCTKQAKQAQTKSEMKERLTLAIQDLQTENQGKATLDDVIQEWIDGKIQDYKCTIKEDASISGKKVIMEKEMITGKFIIDENLNIIEIENDDSSSELEYEVLSRDGENVEILITIADEEKGIDKVEFPDGTIIYCNGNKKFAKDYIVQLGVEYKIKIVSQNGQENEEIILINDYYYTITKNLGEGVSIDNVAIKAAYNKPYQATLTVGDEYIKIDTMTVTMGGQAVTVDKDTGIINIDKVIGDIEIIATAKKLDQGYIIDITGIQSDNCVAINEIEFYNSNNELLKEHYDESGNRSRFVVSNFKLNVYESRTGTVPSYWNYGIWGKENLFDGNTNYGSDSSTVFLYQNHKNYWARLFIYNLSEKVDYIKIYSGSASASEGRYPVELSVYQVKGDKEQIVSENLKTKDNDANMISWGTQTVSIDTSVIAENIFTKP